MLEMRPTATPPRSVSQPGRHGVHPAHSEPIAGTARIQARTAARVLAASRRRHLYRRCRSLCDDIVERLGALGMARGTEDADRLAAQVRADADAILRHVCRLCRGEGSPFAGGAGTNLLIVRSEAAVEALAEELSSELLDAQIGWESAHRQSLTLAKSLRISVHAMTEAYS
jgi:hypothetical protein